MNTERIDCDDVGQAIREDRPLRHAQRYRLRLSVNDLEFEAVTIADPVPTGRQVLEAGGLDERGDYCLFAILPNGDFEDVRLNETFDLRGRGVERFVAFEGDRVLKFRINGRQLAWGLTTINGSQLHELADGQDDESIFLEVRGGTDEMIEPTQYVDLTQNGVERFITGPIPMPSYEITINSRPHVLETPVITFEQVIRLAFPDEQDPLIIYSMTYRCAASQPSAGDLSPGHSIRIKTGTQINVTPTGRA